ncbi:MAG: C_GCAxxG_C_C family protein [Chloroflexi bacterium]|nr:C_GCAxxG_C_C family protein [Chloroflexota bacterium]MBT7080981.1 C_GCAxxG_C_C family protein [Chloroflexota bacterium]MBT7290542.1 C_GCAxxG_C_C family protein [Chloroflexota bacterium]
MSKSSDAHDLMKEHRINCAQSVVSVFCEQLGIDLDVGLRAAMAFGGGMARGGNTCGTVTGAYIVLGLAQTISPENPRESVDITYDLVRQFNEKFTAKHGALACRDLLGCDLSTPDGLAKARDEQLFSNVCPDLVRDSVQILEELLKSK